jgi:F-type H+-transporting ATPase subunit b
VGLYASILPLIAYAAFGSSTTLAVGPVAVSSIMTASVVAGFGASPAEAMALAGMLALLVGGFLMLGGLLRLGFIANLLSHPVISGFTKGIAVLILLSQVKDFLGLQMAKAPAEFFSLLKALWANVSTWNPSALALAAASLVIMLTWPSRWSRRLPAPVVILLGATAAAALTSLPLDTIGTRFGGIPQGLPVFSVPDFSLENMRRLMPAAITLALLFANATALVVLIGMLIVKVPAKIAASLDKQIAGVRAQLDEAKALRAEAERLRGEYEAKAKAAEADAATMRAHAQAEANQIIAKAKHDAEELMARRTKRAEDKIAAAERAAIAEVRALAAETASKAAALVIAEKLDADADRAMIDRSIAGLGRPN